MKCVEACRRLRLSSAGVVADHFLDAVECDAREALGRMRLVHAEQVIQPPHPFGKLGLGNDPAAAKTAEAVNLGQAVGRDELGPKMNGARTRRDCGVEIDLVNEHAGASRRRERAKALKSLSSGKSAAGIVKVGDDDEARAWA